MRMYNVYWRSMTASYNLGCYIADSKEDAIREAIRDHKGTFPETLCYSASLRKEVDDDIKS